MDKTLPSELLIKIFMYLPVDTIQAVADTCLHWRDIIEHFDIWKAHWLLLLHIANQTNLKDIYLTLKQFNPVEANLKQSCVRLKRVLYNNHNLVNNCLLNNENTFEYAVLKTHYSQITLIIFKNNPLFCRNYQIKHVKKNNDIDPINKLYMSFRLHPWILDNINSLFHVHRHVRRLIYIYPMGVNKFMSAILAQFFETQHVEEVVLIPRIVSLCGNLSLEDAIVVYSTSRSTEIAFVVDGIVQKNHWMEVPVGGWQVAKNLHATYRWLHPDAPGDVKRFDDARIKSHCWLRMPQSSNRIHQVKTVAEEAIVIEDNNVCQLPFVLKDEQYLAAELMYTELNLCAVLKRLSVGLSPEQLGRCLGHVLLAGGNCKLKYLHVRLRLELMEMFPENAASVHTSVHGNRALVYTPPRCLLEPLPLAKPEFVTGEPCRITRELYIKGSDVTEHY